MIVRSSHLALRFYLRDGWTFEEVSKYVKIVDAVKDQIWGADLSYFRPDINSPVDINRLVEDGHLAQTFENIFLDKEESLKYFKGFL